MLITFKTTAHANIVMFGDVGLKMLQMMGFGAAVPGAIDAEDVPRALKNLNQALEKMPQQVEAAEDDDDDQPVISLQTRAVPLLQLLRAAAEDETYVRWE